MVEQITLGGMVKNLFDLRLVSVSNFLTLLVKNIFLVI